MWLQWWCQKIHLDLSLMQLAEIVLIGGGAGHLEYGETLYKKLCILLYRNQNTLFSLTRLITGEIHLSCIG